MNPPALVPVPESSNSAEDIQARLAGIERIVGLDPAQAYEQAEKLLEDAPGHPMALLFQGIARRLGGDPAAAIRILAPLCEKWTDAPLPHLQLGLAQRETGDLISAASSMRRAVAIVPDFSDGWRALANLMTAMADRAGADQAFGMYIMHSMRDPRLRAIAAALVANRIEEAEALLGVQLEQHPTDVVALNMRADVALRQSRLDVADVCLRQCLELAPGYQAARHNYAVVLMRQDRPTEALHEVQALLSKAPTNHGTRILQAAILIRLAEFEAAIRIYQDLVRELPGQQRIWASLGHALRTVGRLESCVAAYRKAIALAPDFGEAYWNLANLKTFSFADDELGSMRNQLERPQLGNEDRIHFCFAIGKALEERGAYEESFGHYAEGNRLRRRTVKYDANEITDYVKRCKSLLTAAFFAEREGCGVECRDPIFVVGLPRAGSTLVEQILASHSAVEGTMELPHIIGIAQQLVTGDAGRGPSKYPEALASTSRERFRELGSLYLERTRVQRKLGAPCFIDKMPNNFAHLGLIQLIVPNARIVDIRRHPLACGMSLFKHLFAHAQHFSYCLKDIGRYYRDYADLMAHFDAVLPGRVHRIVYEALVKDPATEVRRLLDYCGLPFEQSCLEFHLNTRAVSTPSSEQVRRPIFRDAVDHWRHYEQWLGPLKTELGALINADPAETFHI